MDAAARWQPRPPPAAVVLTLHAQHVKPIKDALTVLLVLVVVADVHVAVRIYFVALALLLVVEEAAFEDPSVAVQRNPLTVLPVLHRLPEVDPVVIAHQPQT